MSEIKKVFASFIRVSSKLEPCFAKSADSKMNHLSLYIFLLITGLTVAYLASYLPAVFVTIFGGKRHMSTSEVLTANYDTSIMKRSRQQNIPVNPGNFKT